MNRLITTVFLMLLLSSCSSTLDKQYPLTRVPYPEAYCDVKFSMIMVENRRQTTKDHFAKMCKKDEGGEPCDKILLEAIERFSQSELRNSELKQLLEVRDSWCKSI